MLGYILPYVFASLLLQPVFAEDDNLRTWHTSQISLAQLYDLQAEHFAAVGDYLNSESKRLDELKNILAKTREWRDHTISDKNTYVNNHINAIQTMKRIHHQLRMVEDLMDNKQSMEALSKIDEHKTLSENDIRSACRGLRRLQIFYQIPASDMAAGKYRDRVIGDLMSACECYIMSKYCFEEHNMFGASDWAIQAYKRWTKGDQPKCVDVERLIFKLVATSTTTGYNFINLLNSRTNYSEHTENFAQHFHLMVNEVIYPDESRTFDIFDEYNTLQSTKYYYEFRQLCYQHGESRRILTKDCVCQYQTRNSPYQILMPFKEENIHLNPYIKLYHDAIYDDEIEKIKSICLNSLFDASVVSPTGGRLVEEKYRSGKVCRIFDDQAKGVLDSLNTRIERITGWSTRTAEAYQIVNYGLGGHYVHHYDSLNRQRSDNSNGNRFVTVLFYMSDVQYDGSTTFPLLNIVSPARKGTALVWYNLHLNNGSKDLNSMHGSCPILNGNKWIMTRWLYENGQNLPYDWRNATD